MVKFFKGVIDNYYLIYVLLALETYIGFPDLYSLVVILLFFSTFVSANNKPLKWHKMDALVTIFIVYQLISYLFSDYDLYIYYLGIKAQIVPILFYFIGRNIIFSDNEFLNRMKKPMMFAFIVGLILYFWSPGWYISKKIVNLTDTTNTRAFYEMTRLSSFWPWSYAMGYGALYFIMYYTKDVVKKASFWSCFCLITAVLVLFFAQQRISIVFFLLYLVIVSIYGKLSKKILTSFWLLVAVLILAILFWFFNYADTDFVDYVMNRSVDSDDNIIEQRFELFKSFWKISFFGEGLGKYGHAVYWLKNQFSVTDCEYIRFMAELGIAGCFIFFLISLKSLLKAFKYRKYFLFEFCILLFFLIAMIGATPFENSSMQPFLFWYCLGRINAPYLLKQ